MENKTKEIAEKILNTLERQKFNEWYNTRRFNSYIMGEFPKEDPRRITREQILEDIIKLFDLK